MTNPHFITAPNLHDDATHNIAYFEWGQAQAPVVICVHGLTRNARDFDYVARALASNYRVISIDMPGRGDSDWMENSAGYNYPQYMMDCLSVVQHINAQQVQWIGTSMGGIIGMTIAALHPGIITRMLLNDIGAFIPKEALQRIFTYVSQPAIFDSRETAQIALRERFAPFGITKEAHWQHMFTHSLEEASGKWRLRCDPAIIDPIREETENFTKMEDINLFELWEAVDIPTLIMRGAESDILSTQVAQEMAHGHWGIHIEEIQGVGHAPALMDNAQIQLVCDWLEGKTPD